MQQNCVLEILNNEEGVFACYTRNCCSSAVSSADAKRKGEKSVCEKILRIAFGNDSAPQGYAVIENVCSPDECQALRTDFNGLLDVLGLKHFPTNDKGYYELSWARVHGLT